MQQTSNRFYFYVKPCTASHYYFRNLLELNCIQNQVIGRYFHEDFPTRSLDIFGYGVFDRRWECVLKIGVRQMILSEGYLMFDR